MKDCEHNWVYGGVKLRWMMRCYPTDEQQVRLAKTFGCCRFVYNWALAERTKAFKEGRRMGYHESSAALTQYKKQPEVQWLSEVSCVPLQQSLRHLQVGYTAFFEKRSGYPSFKCKDARQSAEYTRSAFRFDLPNQRVSFAKIGWMKVKWSRRVSVEPSTVTIIRKPSGKYFISMVLDATPAPVPATGESIGIDFGISRLATLSTGETIANPKYLNRYQRRVKRLQQSVSRKQKGSRRRARAQVRVAKIHEKIADSRKDTINKLAWNLVTCYDTIYVEDLNLRGMVKNHNLARSLSDAAIGKVIRTLEAKAAMHGKQVVKIDRWFPSSKMCSACGKLQSEMPLSVREWTCECGAHHDRDVNAARNILAVGQTVTAHGDGVRAVRSSGRKANCRRSANQPEVTHV